MPLDASGAEKLLAADDGPARELAIARKLKAGKKLNAEERTYLESIRDGDTPGDAAALPAYCTKSDLAGIVGATRQKLQFHSRKPGFPRPDAAGRYKTADVLAYAKRAGILSRNPGPVSGSPTTPSLHHSVTPGEAEPELIDLNYERALLAREQRREKEIGNAKLRGDLLEMTAVDQAWEMIRSSVRQRIIALPSKIESQSHLEPEPRAKLRKILDREIDDVLTELAKPPDYQLAATAEQGPPESQGES